MKEYAKKFKLEDLDETIKKFQEKFQEFPGHFPNVLSDRTKFRNFKQEINEVIDKAISLNDTSSSALKFIKETINKVKYLDYQDALMANKTISNKNTNNETFSKKHEKTSNKLKVVSENNDINFKENRKTSYETYFLESDRRKKFVDDLIDDAIYKMGSEQIYEIKKDLSDDIEYYDFIHHKEKINRKLVYSFNPKVDKTGLMEKAQQNHKIRNDIVEAIYEELEGYYKPLSSRYHNKIRFANCKKQNNIGFEPARLQFKIEDKIKK